MSKRTRLGDTKTAIAYVRVSTTDQKLGPEAQRASIEAWAAHEGVTVAAWFVDQGVSGASPIEARDGLCAALAALREHNAGVLVVAKRDRVARDVVIAATVERAATKAGARLISADGTGNGDTAADGFMRTVIDGAAAYERALIRSRTKAALAAKSVKGERVSGGIPYGFALDVDGVHLVALENEKRVIAIVRELAASGVSLRAIASRLAGLGHVSRTGKVFAAVQVARMLERAGDVEDVRAA